LWVFREQIETGGVPGLPTAEALLPPEPAPNHCQSGQGVECTHHIPLSGSVPSHKYFHRQDIIMPYLYGSTLCIMLHEKAQNIK